LSRTAQVDNDGLPDMSGHSLSSHAIAGAKRIIFPDRIIIRTHIPVKKPAKYVHIAIPGTRYGHR
uniref:hypothetical protein n=1 Tax=uncultured Desulfovibrio sp. TaxID=167968 RepID=UPI002611E34E